MWEGKYLRSESSKSETTPTAFLRLLDLAVIELMTLTPVIPKITPLKRRITLGPQLLSSYKEDHNPQSWEPGTITVCQDCKSCPAPEQSEVPVAKWIWTGQDSLQVMADGIRGSEVWNKHEDVVGFFRYFGTGAFGRLLLLYGSGGSATRGI